MDYPSKKTILIKRVVGLGFILALITLMLFGYQNCNQVSLLNDQESFSIMSGADMIDFYDYQSNCDNNYVPISIDLSDKNIRELGLDTIDYDTTSLVFFCKRKKPIKDKKYKPCLDIGLDRKGKPNYFEDLRIYFMLSKNGVPINPHFSYITLSEKNYEFSMYVSLVINGDTRRLYLEDNTTKIKFTNNCH